MAKRRKAPKTKTRYVTRVKKVARRTKGSLGIGSIKELAMTALMLTAGKVVVDKVAPGIPFKGGVSAIAGGGIASVTGLPGKRLIQYGIADAGSDLIANVINGGGFSLGGAVKGRYDL